MICFTFVTHLVIRQLETFGLRSKPEVKTIHNVLVMRHL